MDMRELVTRAAGEAGVGEEAAGRVVEAFLGQLRAAIAEGRTVILGELGTFRGTSFTPGRALGESAAAAFSDTAGYDEGTAPSDS
jgi:nucleoid DNA-binding protein